MSRLVPESAVMTEYLRRLSDAEDELLATAEEDEDCDFADELVPFARELADAALDAANVRLLIRKDLARAARDEVRVAHEEGAS